MSVTEPSEAETTEHQPDAAQARPTLRAHMGLDRLGHVGSLGGRGDAGSARRGARRVGERRRHLCGGLQLLDDLVADVKTTNDELSTFNEQFESAVASAQAAAAEAKQKQSERSSSREPSP